MAVLNFNAPASAPAAAGTAAQERPKSQIWLNVGVTLPMTQEDGTIEDTFVSLPVGIPIDTTAEVEMRGKNVSWHQMVQAKNHLLNFLKEAGAQLQPGEAHTINGLQLELRRSGQPEAPAVGENPLLAAMAGKLSVGS